MADPNLTVGTGASLFDAAEWAVLSTGVLETDPPLVVEALTFTVPDYLQPLFEHLTTTGTGDANILAEFVAEASGLEFDSFGAVIVRGSMPSAEFARRVDSLLREFVGVTGIEGGGELAAELAELRLPVFGSQPHDFKPLKELVEGTGDVLMCIGVLAGTNAHALLAFAGPVGAIITLGTYAILGGAWAIHHIRQLREAQRKDEAERDAVIAKERANDEAKRLAKEEAAALAARHEATARRQARMKAKRPKIHIKPR